MRLSYRSKGIQDFPRNLNNLILNVVGSYISFSSLRFVGRVEVLLADWLL